MPELRKPCDELITFMDAYPDYVKEMALQLREKVLAESPDSFELIYDSYNALSLPSVLQII